MRKTVDKIIQLKPHILILGMGSYDFLQKTKNQINSN